MIPADQVTGIVVTRGDVALGRVCEPLIDADLKDVLVYDNSLDEDLAVYGRYAAIENTDTPVILVVDDDVALSEKAIFTLLAAYEPGKIVANMPAEYRTRYTDSCLVGFGAIFGRELPKQAFKRVGFDPVVSPFPEDDWWDFTTTRNGQSWTIPDGATFRRTADVFFTTLTPFALIDEPFEYLPWTRAPNRMYRQEGNGAERQRILELARNVRDAA